MSWLSLLALQSAQGPQRDRGFQGLHREAYRDHSGTKVHRDNRGTEGNSSCDGREVVVVVVVVVAVAVVVVAVVVLKGDLSSSGIRQSSSGR